jgi:hypothetical protein
MSPYSAIANGGAGITIMSTLYRTAEHYPIISFRTIGFANKIACYNGIVVVGFNHGI